jgi:glycosyltransferase involved in cell wall biosynthesis
MKILYVSPEHVSGTLTLFQDEHRRRGDECRFVTFWHSRWDFPDDICLRLPMMPDRAWVRALRHVKHLRFSANAPRNTAAMPYWRPGALESLLFRWRDEFLWPRIRRAIEACGLDSFDVIQFDGGLDFTRDGRFSRRMAASGKRIVCFYHGSDMRSRGILRALDEVAALRLSSEWDLIELDERLRYLYLPLDTRRFPEREYRFHKPIRICHASRNPYKGTPHVAAAVDRLARRHPVTLTVLRDLSHAEAMKIKGECDIFVDQLTNAGGWGYGMSSVEALAIGMPVVTNIPAPMAARLGEHPFVQAAPENVTDVLESLIESEGRCRDLAAEGRAWVRQRHDVRAVGEQLYAYYREAGWIPAS